MTYTAAEVLTIIGALGVFVGALSLGIVNVIVALRTERKQDVLVAAVQGVHDATNSNMTLIKAELSTALVTITGLRDTIQDLKSEREKTAITAAIATVPPQTAPVLSAVPIEASLLKIEANTLATVDAVKDQGKA